MAHEKTLMKPEERGLMGYEPWNTFRDMERAFHEFFTSPFPMMRPSRWLSELRSQTIPEVDLKETDKEIILSAVLPGMEKDDIDIDVTDDNITISGERKMSEELPGEKVHFRQQSYGAFRFSYMLPANVKSGEVKAIYKSGVLEVTMPKAEVKEAHKVSVETQ